MLQIKNGKLFTEDDGHNAPLVEVEESQMTRYLNIHLDNHTGDESVTLADVLELFETYPIAQLIFPRYEFLRDEVQRWKNSTTTPVADYDDPVVRLTLSTHVEYTESDFNFEFNDAESLNLNDATRVKSDTTYEAQIYMSMSGVGEGGTSYSMSLSPLSSMMNIPIETSSSLQVVHETSSYDNGYDTKTLVDHPTMPVTLYEFLDVIIEELTFYGSDEDKVEVCDELKTAMDEVMGMENTKPID